MINRKFNIDDKIVFRNQDSIYDIIKCLLFFNLDNYVYYIGEINDSHLVLTNNYSKKIINIDDLNDYEYYYYEKNANKYIYRYANNIGKKRDKYMIYRLAHIISSICDLYLFYIWFGNVLALSFLAIYIYISTIFAKIIALIQSNTTNVQNAGMCISGAYCGVYICKIINIYLMNYFNIVDTTILIQFISISTGIRIFLTRTASWLINDFPGNWNPNTNRPYDAALYEGILEGLITSFVFYLSDYNLDIYSLMYFLTRMIIEIMYKPFNFQSYIDCIFISCMVYYLYVPTIIYGLLLVLLYIDTIIRYNNNIKTLHFNNILLNKVQIKINIQLTKNYGFYSSINTELNNMTKIIMNILSIIIFGLFFYLLGPFDLFLLFLMSVITNLLERSFRGYVTDYIMIQTKYLKTNVFNIADFNIIVCFILLLRLVQL